jgi:exoribonuclease R
MQDRYVSECCLAACAGIAPPDWVRAGLAALPSEMSAASQRAGRVERGVVDLVEATLLTGREGERFDAVVIDDKLVQLAQPAVRGALEGPAPEPGTPVVVRLDQADAAMRKVRFSVA